MAVSTCSFDNVVDNSYESFSSYCSNFSSLDSSKQWTYIADFHNPSYLNVAPSFFLMDDSYSNTLTRYPNQRFFQISDRTPANSSFSFVLTPSRNYNYFLFTSLNGNISFDSFIISDEGVPSDCPVCEECQQCPVVPDNPYDDKLDNITQAIYVCAAVVLVVYFFYCIYRMLIKNSGVK